MLEEVLEMWPTRTDGLYVDGTFGRGGHSRALLARLDAGARLVGVDRDPEAVLEGEKNAYRDICLLNSGAALVVAGRVKTLKDGMKLAAESLDHGHALATLNQLIEVSNRGATTGDD